MITGSISLVIMIMVLGRYRLTSQIPAILVSGLTWKVLATLQLYSHSLMWLDIWALLSLRLLL